VKADKDPEVPAGPIQPKSKSTPETSEESSNDFWEFEKGKGAWRKIHIKPRKRLFAPVGNDCPFGAEEISSKRVTVWKCRGKTSIYSDDWRSNQYQRIWSKSWVGKTWTYPKNEIDPKRATVQPAAANAKHSRNNLLKGEEAAFSILDGLPKNVKDHVVGMLSSVEPHNHSDACRKAKTGQQVMLEFCCSPESSLGKIHEGEGIMHFRLTKESNDLTGPE